MESWQCTYTKTYNGACDQPQERGSDKCYYHNKVANGLIDTDEQTVMREMPTIALV